MKSKAYTRQTLAVDLSLTQNLPLGHSRAIVDSVIGLIGRALVDQQRVEFRDFGSFQVVNRKAKIGRNPRNPSAGQFKVPARKGVKFRLGDELYQQLNPNSTTSA